MNREWLTPDEEVMRLLRDNKADDLIEDGSLPYIAPPIGLAVTEYRDVALTDIRQSESTNYPLTAEQIAEGNETEQRR